jgi:hypothetical protein
MIDVLDEVKASEAVQLHDEDSEAAVRLFDAGVQHAY